MAYERSDRDSSSHGQEDDRQRLSGRGVQDDDTGNLGRRFDDRGDDDAYRGRPDRDDLRDDDDQRSRGEAGGDYGVPHGSLDKDRGHAFAFARSEPDRPDTQEGSQPRDAQDRFGDSRQAWPEKGNYISRYVSAGGRADEGRSATPAASSFRGKGPKGYVRSDDRIKEDVSDRLSDDETLDASEITVEVAGGEVTLSGYVDSRQAKRTAEDCAEQCTGVTQLQNNLRVGNAAGRDQGATNSGSEQHTNEPKTTDV